MNKPNIFLIMCDQLCASVLPCYGGRADAPNIQRLAERGMVFDAAYCTTPVCTPSRASIVTGQYPHRHGVVTNVMRVDYPARGGPETEEGIDRRDVTTEGLLHASGYAVSHAGKWHLSGEKPACYPEMYTEHLEYGVEMRETLQSMTKDLPNDRVMDWYGWKLPVTCEPTYRAAVAGLADHGYYQDFLTKMGRLDLPIEDTFDYRLTTKCIESINTAGEKPFMATCSFNMPHDPNVVPSPYYESVDMSGIIANSALPCDPLYMNNLSKTIPQQAGDVFLREFLRVYYASVKLVDDQIGRLLDVVDDNTIIIFTADHGDMAGRHGMFWKSTDAFYDEVARVPLIICAPGANAGRYAGPVELVDIMPTILELCGLPVPENIDGVSLVPALQDGKISRADAICERLGNAPGNRRVCNRENNGSYMLRTQQYKYVCHNNGGKLLFDMENDPCENENLIDCISHNEIAAQMYSRLKERLAQSGQELGYE
ncbi:MAG: sulfatase-like hydrolase/transferase [Clostridia bacterium]|nr:sulfatase-like hydrolase/transferase [Clostridia bacterium]